MGTVIKVEDLSKKYQLGTISHGVLFRDIQSKWARLRGKPDPNLKIDETHSEAHQSFWALKDVNFKVEEGEVLGIIGRNGAGKSTLLKILSRVTAPTTGQVFIKGRIASLLEVGTGFHPELTGRENIFLNGSILGMTRAEIKKKFDEIVSFADIEKFIDTPVKRYSSGMYVRLAFAVAANLESEILIVDEVLAVGDSEFQKKCLGKMGQVSKAGRTVLFVSHNMETMANLCQKGIALNSGTIMFSGDIASCISTYNDSIFNTELSALTPGWRARPQGAMITNLWLMDKNGNRPSQLSCESEIFLCLEAKIDSAFQDGKRLIVGFGVDNHLSKRLFTCVSAWADTEIITSGEYLKVVCHVPNLPLVTGTYFLSASISMHAQSLDYVEHGHKFEILNMRHSAYLARTPEQGPIDMIYKFNTESRPQ